MTKEKFKHTAREDLHNEELKTTVNLELPKRVESNQGTTIRAAANQTVRLAYIAQKRENEQLRELTSRDSLTGLLNKGAFLDKLESDLKQGKQIGLLFIDLNNFKQVNDQISHVAGDELLKAFSNLLTSSVRESDELGYGGVSNDIDDSYNIGRFGGDEFWLSVDLSSRDGVVKAEALDQVKERIDLAMPGFIAAQPGANKLTEVGFNAAVGAVVPREGESVAQLIERASAEMKLHKAALKS